MVPLYRRPALVVQIALAAAATVALGATDMPARAQAPAPEPGLQRYRDMMRADPWANPGNLDADRGELLWRSGRGPRGATLEACDLGKGPGVVQGAFAELPRYFSDAGRVMDVETRLMWCMETIQGIPRAELTARPHAASGQPARELAALATFVASRSSGGVLAPRLEHPRERQARALGEALFHRRQGPLDFSCAGCHSLPDKRIRLQELSQLTDPAAARQVIGEWPAYRVSSNHTMSMQHRIYDCYWQMRLPEIGPGSPVTVALISYLTHQAAGGPITVPGLKR